MDCSQATELCATCVLWLVSVSFVPVHFDLPVGGRGQRDPFDLSSVVVAVSTTKEHLTTLLAFAKIVKKQQQKTNVRHIFMSWETTHIHSQPRAFHSVSLPAQVDREQGLLHQLLFDHVVKDWHNIVRGNGLEGQSQDTISCHVSHEGSL